MEKERFIKRQSFTKYLIKLTNKEDGMDYNFYGFSSSKRYFRLGYN
jgi:hypothetical protein